MLAPNPDRIRIRSAAATMGVFAAGIAHEIRSPVGAILSSVSVLERAQEKGADNSAASQAETLSAGVSEALKGISAAARRLEEFVDSLEALQTQDLDDEQVGSLTDALNAALAAANSEGVRAILEGEPPKCYCQFPVVRHMMQMLVERLAIGIDDQSRLMLRAGIEQRRAWIEIRSDDARWTRENLQALLDIRIGAGDGKTARLEVGIVAALLLLQELGGEVSADDGDPVGLRLGFPIVVQPPSDAVVEAAEAV